MCIQKAGKHCNAVPQISKVYWNFNITNRQIYEKKSQVRGMALSCFKKNVPGYANSYSHIISLYNAIICIGIFYAELQDFTHCQGNET